MNNTKHIIPFLALILLIPVGVTSSFAQEIPGEEPKEAYEKSDILHAFDVMNNHIIIDENYHLIVNVTAAENDPRVSELDIQIAFDFAMHSDNLIDIVSVGPVGQVSEDDTSYNEQIHQVIEDFESSEFSVVSRN